MRRIEVTVSDLIVGPELFERLPPKYGESRAIFSPSGSADFTFEQRRENGKIRKKCLLRPKNMAGNYRGFPYPVDRIRGTIEATLDDDTPHRYEIDLVAEAQGKPVTLKGVVIGGPERELDLVLTGSDISLDKELIAALPDEYPKFMAACIRRLVATSPRRSAIIPASAGYMARKHATTNSTFRFAPAASCTKTSPTRFGI